MKRAMAAFHEWMQLRSRLREERQFHLERAAEDWRALGISARAARRAARERLGSRRQRKLALAELGGDGAGLLRLLLAHRVDAAPSFPPLILVTVSVLILLVSPSPRLMLEGVAGQPLAAHDRGAVFISSQARNLTFAGVTAADFELIRSVSGLSDLARFQSTHVRAHLRSGASLAATETLVRAMTGNRSLRVVPLFERHPIVMGPAKAVWGLLAGCALFFGVLYGGRRRWLAYGFAVGGLQALASLAAWALAFQWWSRTAWATDGRALFGLLLLLAVYLGVVALQIRIWWHDMYRRCPCCLERLLLPLTVGSADCLLLDSVTTESVCAHGHGVLVETRWMCRFRPERSPLQGLVHG